MDRRDRYLDAALELFAAHGFVGTSTDMIVAEVGGSKATLYKHFPTKDALVAGLMDQVSESIARFSNALDDDQPLEDALDQFGRDVLRGVTSRRALVLLRLCLGEYGRFPELAAVVWKHGPAVTYRRFRAFLEARTKRGELCVEDSQLAAEQFLAGIVGHIQLKVAMGQTGPLNEKEIARRVKSSTRLFLAGYGTRRLIDR